MLDERNEIPVECGETVDAAGIVIAKAQHGKRVAAPIPAGPMLVGVKASARVEADAKGLGNPVQLRNHA
jgi:hypothetical protein